MKTIRTVLSLLLGLVATTPAWAFSVRSREFCGSVEILTTPNQEVVVTDSTGKRLTAIWTKDTIFVHDGKLADASALGARQPLCAYYRSPWFGPVYLTKVVW